MKRKAAVFVPLLLFVVFLLVGFSDSMVSAVQSVSANAFLSVSIIQLLVFLLPMAFYCGLNKIPLFTRVRFGFGKLRNVPFLILISLCFLFGAVTLKFLSYALFGEAAAHTSSVISAALYTSNAPLVILCFVLFPAILEETLFRGLVFSEYQSYGPACAILLSALTFAMVHFSFQNFLFYCFAGLVFAVMTQVAGTVLPAILLHAVFNALDLYFESSFFSYVGQTGVSGVLFYLFCGGFLLFLVLTLSNLERSYSARARSVREGAKVALEEETASRAVGSSQPTALSTGARVREVFLSPSLILLVVLFLLYATKIIA